MDRPLTGVATPKEMKDRLLRIARGEETVKPDDPKLWHGPNVSPDRATEIVRKGT